MQQRSNPFAFDKPITLDTLGELFSHHRGLTGGWTMEEQPGGEGGQGGDGGGGNEPPKFEPITSQEELDKRIGPRLAREREKYSDYEDLKRKAAEYDAAAEAAKTEQEKAVDAARKEGETAALERANTRLVAAEAKALAAQANAHNPAVVAKMLDLSAVKVGDDGEVDAAALKTKLDELKASDPYLFSDGKTKPRPDPSQGGGGKPDRAGVDRGREMFEARRKKTSA